MNIAKIFLVILTILFIQNLFLFTFKTVVKSKAFTEHLLSIAVKKLSCPKKSPGPLIMSFFSSFSSFSKEENISTLPFSTKYMEGSYSKSPFLNIISSGKYSISFIIGMVFCMVSSEKLFLNIGDLFKTILFASFNNDSFRFLDN